MNIEAFSSHKLVDPVDKHDTVVHDNTDQGDDSDKAEECEILIVCDVYEYHTDEKERYCCEYDQRIDERLELCRHDRVNEEQGKKEYHNRPLTPIVTK